MTVSVRPACYDSDEQELIAVLQTNLPYRQHARFFHWLYRENPAGQAVAWVATDQTTKQIIGAAAAFPRPVLCSGTEARGYVLGDFCIDPPYRSLGLALTLQRTCLNGLSSASAAVALDFPSQTMLAIYKRLRIEVNTTLVRYAKLLRADRKIAEHMPVRLIADGLSAVVNAGLRLHGNRGKPTNWTIATETGPWGGEFTKAALEWSPGTGSCVLRTADYLNWRYRQHPVQSYEMVAARQGDKLCGYLIFHMNGGDCIIDDLLAENDPARRALLAEATAVAYKRRVHTLSVPWLSTHRGRHLVEQCGFRPRESRPVILMALSPQLQHQDRLAANDWYFTLGDWEA